MQIFIKNLRIDSIFCAAILSAAMILNCGGTANMSKNSGTNSGKDGSDQGQNADQSNSRSGSSLSNSSRHFEKPSDLDKMLDEKPITLAAVKNSSSANSGAMASNGMNGSNNSSAGLNGNGISESTPSNASSSSGKGKFHIQIGAESDMDAAQVKKANFEKQLGSNVNMVFDAPYYKLQWGNFNSKQDAEDKLLELSDLKIQGFVVK